MTGLLLSGGPGRAARGARRRGTGDFAQPLQQRCRLLATSVGQQSAQLVAQVNEFPLPYEVHAPTSLSLIKIRSAGAASKNDE